MDENRIPKRFLIDTGVLIRALEYESVTHSDDTRTKDCRDLWVTALRAGREIMIAAPSIVELRAKVGAPPVPKVKQIPVLPFTRFVADDLVTWAGEEAVREVASDSQAHRKLVRFDAMIVACARWSKAACVVSIDRHVAGLAKLAGIECHGPEYFRASQGSLPGV